jgi:hypothetical protein
MQAAEKRAEAGPPIGAAVARVGVEEAGVEKGSGESLQLPPVGVIDYLRDLRRALIRCLLKPRPAKKFCAISSKRKRAIRATGTSLRRT